MAETKKISDLKVSTELVEDNIHFVVVDKSITSGDDASTSGRTSKVTLAQIRNAVDATGPKGERGEKGDDGERGFIGQKGELGEKGDRGIPGRDGDDGEKGQIGVDGQQGIQGIPGIQGIQGKKGEQGEKGSLGPDGPKGSTSSVNDTLSLVKSDSLSWDSTKNKISKLTNGGQWNSTIISNVGFGTFNLAFGVGQTNKNLGIGISIVSSEHLYDPHINAIFVGFHLKSNGTYDILNLGKKINTNGSLPYNTNSIFSMSFDKVKFTITLDGVTVGQFGFSGDAPAYVYALDCTFYDTGTNLTDFISFTPGANAIMGPKGTDGQKGQKGEETKGQKGEPLEFTDLSSTQKNSLKGAPGAKLNFNDLSSAEKTSLKGQKGATGSATVTTNASAITSGVLNVDRVPTLPPTKIRGIGNLDYTGKLNLYRDGKWTTEIHSAGSINLGADLNSGLGVHLNGKPGQSNMLSNPLAIGGANGQIPSGNKLWVNGDAIANNWSATSAVKTNSIFPQNSNASIELRGAGIGASKGVIINHASSPNPGKIAEFNSNEIVFHKPVKFNNGSSLDDRYVDWDSFAPVMFDITKEYRAQSGFFVTRYWNYHDGTKYVSTGNGAYGTYSLLSAWETRPNTTVIPGSHEWIAKAINTASTPMKLKVNYMFGSDTDDNTKFGVFYQVTSLTSNVITADKWVALPGTDANAFRGNGWGGARQNVSRMYNRHGADNVEITVPAKHYVYLRVYGALWSGSNQYESVGLKSFSIHSPSWS